MIKHETSNFYFVSHKSLSGSISIAWHGGIVSVVVVYELARINQNYL